MNNRILSRKITYVKVKDFQTHVDSVLYLDKGMNLIVGTSDSGKTALAKAINFVIYNTSDSEYVRYFSKQLEVEIHFEDGAIIKRIKGKNINQVAYKYPDDFDFTIYSFFGTVYPDAVLEFLGNPILSKVLGALSYSEQKNKLFLIDLPDSVQPKIISAVIGTEDIQKAADFLASDVRDCNDKIKNCEIEIRALEEKLNNDYINLDENTKTLNSILDKIEKISNIEFDIVKIESIIEKFISLRQRARNAKDKIDYYTSISNILETKISNLETISSKIKNMNNLKIDLDNKESKVLIAKNSYDKLKRIIDSNLSNNLNKIHEYISTYDSLIELDDLLSKNINKQDTVILKISNHENDIKLNQSELDQAFQIIRKNNWSCKTCNKFGGEIMA